MSTKKCAYCKQQKPIDHFFRYYTRVVDSYVGCKACRKALMEQRKKPVTHTGQDASSPSSGE